MKMGASIGWAENAMTVTDGLHLRANNTPRIDFHICSIMANLTENYWYVTHVTIDYALRQPIYF
jgi:hypothetical protein